MKQTFAEQLPDWLPAFCRRTDRLTQLIRQVGLEVGGETGRRLLSLFQVHVSGDTVLRVVRNDLEQDITSPRVIGVDDWAFRKGRTYGHTSLVSRFPQRHEPARQLHRSSNSPG